MESLKFENHTVIGKFLLKEWCDAIAIHQRLIAVYGDSALNYYTVTRRFNEFKRGHQSLEDDFRSGRPSDAVNPISIRDCKRVTSLSCEY